MARKPDPFVTDEDNPALTDEELASVKSAAEFLPAETLSALRASEPKRRPGQRGPGKRPAKVVVSLRLDPDIADRWRSTGPGWQSRIGAIVERAAPKVKRRA